MAGVNVEDELGRTVAAALQTLLTQSCGGAVGVGTERVWDIAV
jgi:hypothetical protein